ncbi:MAG: sel1 repeat family protein [Verrucomicrobiales bacterium]|nr:sel1 repeat family protein [Verrucomicrobiales bacterium]
MNPLNHPFVLAVVACVTLLQAASGQINYRGISEEVRTERRKGLAALQRGAAEGNVAAMTALGLEYVGRLEHLDDLAEAERWLRRASEKGYAPAQTELGILLVDYRRTQAALKEADEWLGKATAQGFQPALHFRVYVYVNSLGSLRDPERAIQLLIPSAEAGDRESQFLLGSAYSKRALTSQGVVVGNQEIAIEWYEKAAQQGLVEAQFEMGNSFYYGSKNDFHRAAAWFRVPAEQGNAEAMRKIAFCMLAGNKASEDEKRQAIRWLERAIDAGDTEAASLLKNIRDTGYISAHFRPDPASLADALGRAEKGDVDSMLFLAVSFWNGSNTPVDRSKGASWFRAAAEKGNAWAMYRYGMAVEGGQGAAASFPEAIGWYERAAAAGHRRANRELLRLYALGLASFPAGKSFPSWLREKREHLMQDSLGFLGELYWKGELVPKNVGRAIYCYTQAADQKDPLALNRLGEMHLQGIGGTTNLNEALYWFRAAAKQHWAPAQLNLADLYVQGSVDSTNLPKAWILASLAAHSRIPRASSLAFELESKLDALTLVAARTHLNSALASIVTAPGEAEDWRNFRVGGFGDPTYKWGRQLDGALLP